MRFSLLCGIILLKETQQMPKISIIVPVYKAQAYIRKCLTSLLKQTLTDYELIFVNDGTPDNSMEIIKEYDDPRIKIINQENTGAGAARNVGMKAAKGEYLSVLDADDFFEPQMLETLYNKAKEEKADIVVCGYRIFDDRKQRSTQELAPSIIMSGKPEDFGDNLLSMQSPNAWTKLYKTSFIRKYNLEFDNVPYCNDMAFVFSSMFCASKIVSIPDILINYRYFTATQASFNKPQNLDLLIRSLLTTKDKMLEQGLYKKFERIYIEGIRARFQHEVHAGMAPHKKDAILGLKNIIPQDIFKKMFDAKIAVSLIVPVYNVEPFLRECLDSLINQTLPNIEIICVNDGSTDNSLSILREYEKKDKRITIIDQENKGLPVARRVASRIAKGEYLQFVDSDDYLDLTACECLYLYARLYDHDMLSFKAIDFNNETREKRISPYHSLVWVPKNLQHTFNWKTIRKFLTSYASTACLTIYRRKFLEDNNIEWVNKKLCYEDTPFFTKSIFLAQRVGVLKEALYYRRVHKESITQNKSKHFLDYLESITLSLEEVNKNAPSLIKEYVRLYLKVAFNHFKKFEFDTKQAYTKPFVECIRNIVYKYCRTLPKNVCRWYKIHR